MLRLRTVGALRFSAKNAYAYFCLPTPPSPLQPKMRNRTYLEGSEVLLPVCRYVTRQRKFRCPEGPTQTPCLIASALACGVGLVQVPRALTAGVNYTSSVVLSNGSKQHLRCGGQVNHSAGSARQAFLLCSVEWQCESTRIHHRPTMRCLL